MGSLFTTAGGTELTGITSGTAFLDFMAGTVTLPDGTVSNMNKNLNDLGLNQCNSIAIWCSDADATYQVGSAVTLSDHQLSHVVNNYGFSTVNITIPSNSTPDNTNQLFFMASTDGWLGYGFPRISHQRGSISSTSTNSYVVELSKHVGAYNQFMITTVNTHGSNSIDIQIQYSEDGETWFIDQGYTTAVAIAGGATPDAFDSWASEVEHHFYRIQVKSTVTDSHATFEIYYNFVNDRGSAFL